MKERRKNKDRRHYELAPERGDRFNRRVSPDRRLNSITAVWIPINHLYVHPLTRDVFNKH